MTSCLRHIHIGEQKQLQMEASAHPQTERKEKIQWAKDETHTLHISQNQKKEFYV